MRLTAGFRTPALRARKFLWQAAEAIWPLDPVWDAYFAEAQSATVDGNHFSMIRSPHATNLCRQIGLVVVGPEPKNTPFA